MKYTERVADTNKRLAVTRTWADRISAMKLLTRLQEGEFCDRHKIDQTQLSHIKAGRRGATWDFIDKVETALAAEGQPGDQALNNPVENL